MFVGYSIGTSNYPERILLFDSTHIMNMANPVAINVETLRIDSGCYLEIEFTKFIHINS